MKNELVVDTNSLLMLFHALFRENEAALQLFVPYFKPPLMKIEPGGSGFRITILPKANQYNRSVSGNKSRNGSAEVPGFDNLRDILVQSGIISYPNLGALRKKLANQAHRDYFLGERPLYLALDTNLLRDRFYTSQKEWLDNLAAYRVGFLISPYTKFELNFTRNKYRDRAVGKLLQRSVHRHFEPFLRKLFNQNNLEDRRRRLGFMELNKLHRHQWARELAVLEDEELQKDGDANIILSYRQAVEERNIDILLLSRDSDFIARAEGISGIEPMLLETPRFNTKNLPACDVMQLSQMLYCLAVTFGAIGLRGGDGFFVLCGAWTGKRPEDWRQERMQLFIDPDHPLAIYMSVNLDILTEMQWT